MEQKSKYKGIYWLIFLASTGALLYGIYDHWAWLPFLLPFIATSFVKAMDLI